MFNFSCAEFLLNVSNDNRISGAPEVTLTESIFIILNNGCDYLYLVSRVRGMS